MSVIHDEPGGGPVDTDILLRISDALKSVTDQRDALLAAAKKMQGVLGHTTAELQAAVDACEEEP